MPSFLTSAAAQSSTGNNATTSSVSTLGARMLVAFVFDADGSSVVSDSQSNTWTSLTTRSGTYACRIHYCINPTTSAAHTFTATSTGKKPYIIVQAFSTSATPSYGSENGAFAATPAANPRHTGTVTPATANAVVVTCAGTDCSYCGLPIEQDAPGNPSTGFTTTDNALPSGSVAYGGGAAYKVVSSTSAVDGLWYGNYAFFPDSPSAIAVFSEPVVTGGGGGTIPSVSDPDAGETFTGRSTGVRFWVEIAFDDETRYFAPDGFSAADGLRRGHVISIGEIGYYLSSLTGEYRMSEVTVEIDDSSRFHSALEAASTSQHWLNREVRIMAASPETLAAGGTASCLFRGVWRGRSTAGLRHTYTFVSRFGSEMFSAYLDRTVPSRTFRDDFSARLTAQTSTDGNPVAIDSATLGKVVPIAYGTISDAQVVADEGRYSDQRRGKIAPVYVGLVTCADAVERHEWVLCGHAIKQIDDSYLDDVWQDPNADYIGPQSTAWSTVVGANKYVEYNSHRYTTVYRAKGDTADAIVSGEKLWTFNIQGVEDVGDGSGQTIIRAPRILWHLLNNWFLQSYETGTWPTAPTSADGVSWLNHSSFTACEAWEYLQVGGDGYTFGLYLDTPMTGRQLLQRATVEGLFFFNESQAGQLCAHHPPTAASTTDAITDTAEIQIGTRIGRPIDEIKNTFVADWDFRQADGSFGHTGDTWDATAPPGGFAADPDALDATNGRLVGGDRTEQFRWIVWGTMLTNVVAVSLLYRKRIPVIPDIVGPFHLRRIAVGDCIPVTDVEGVGSTGWTARPIWMTDQRIRLGGYTDAPTVALSGRDVYGLV